MKLTLPLAWRLDWGVLTARLASALLLALLGLLTQHGLPRETKDYMTFCAALLAAAITALPSALQASGFKRPISPEFASLCARLGQLFARPGVSAADVQAAVSAEMRVITPQLVQLVADENEKRINKTNMAGFSPAELGQAELGKGAASAGTDGQDDPDTQNDPDAPTGASPATTDTPAASNEAIAQTDAITQNSITQTGGNQ